MIRLFRKIRQQLLSENNYGMYILYASGEIILVMIGILLALQVIPGKIKTSWIPPHLNFLQCSIRSL